MGPPTSPFRSPAALLRFGGVALAGVAVDLWTKVYAFQSLLVRKVERSDGRFEFESRVFEFLPGWLHFQVTGNHGAVFGLGQGQRWLFLAVSLAAVAFLVFLFARSAGQRGYQLLLGMMLAGVVGNAYDRLFIGYVRDMIHALPGKTWSLIFGAGDGGSWRDAEIFPWIFNVADSLLCVGVALMIAHSLILETRRTPAPAAATDA